MGEKLFVCIVEGCMIWFMYVNWYCSFYLYVSFKWIYIEIFLKEILKNENFELNEYKVFVLWWLVNYEFEKEECNLMKFEEKVLK